MKFLKPIPVKDIAIKWNAKLLGDQAQLALGINEIHKVSIGDISFVDVEKYFQKALYSEASIIILNKEVEPPSGKTLIVVDKPFDVYNTIVGEELIKLKESASNKIHSSVIIEQGAIVEEYVNIGANSFIQAGAIIKNGTSIGENVIIQSGAIIGTDAFYFKKEAGKYLPWISGGGVVIENNVQIGGGTTINKCVSANTIIGEGSKLDCQIQIGHGVEIGKNCLIAAQVGIAGNTIIEDNCTIYGQVGIGQNLRIGANATLLATTAVSKDLKGDKTYFGIPAMEATKYARQLAMLKNLAE
jgi:UDP-3-O-[3-hydroxymyristoyl] glucosamine N-acyltransferase